MKTIQQTKDQISFNLGLLLAEHSSEYIPYLQWLKSVIDPIIEKEESNATDR